MWGSEGAWSQVLDMLQQELNDRNLINNAVNNKSRVDPVLDPPKEIADQIATHEVIIALKAWRWA